MTHKLQPSQVVSTNQMSAAAQTSLSIPPADVLYYIKFSAAPKCRKLVAAVDFGGQAAQAAAVRAGVEAAG